MARSQPLSLAVDQVRCRTLGHSWDPIPVTKPPRYGVAIDLRCEHCYTVRRDIVNRYSGQIMSRQYDYQDEYRDHEHHARSDWRVMWVDTLSDALRVVGPEADQELEDKPQLRIVKRNGRKRNVA